jgi:hypothetical protein
MFCMTAFRGHDDDFLYEVQVTHPPPQYPRIVLRSQDAKIIKRPGIRGRYYRLRSLARRLHRFINEDWRSY